MLCVLLELTPRVLHLDGWCLAVAGLQSDDATILECPMLRSSVAAPIPQAQTLVLQLQGSVELPALGLCVC